MLSLREFEGPQRKTSRGGPPHLRISISDSNLTRPRSTNNSPRFGYRQSPRVAQSNPNLSQKKLGTKIANLESQLGQAHLDLKNLKGQLANAKNEAQELEKKTKKPKAKDLTKVEDDGKEEKKVSDVPNEGDRERGVFEAAKKEAPELFEKKMKNEKVEYLTKVKDNKNVNEKLCEDPDESHHETNVFEVPIEMMTLEDPKYEIGEIIDPDIDETKPVEVKKPSFTDLAMKDDEISLLKAKLDEKDMELEASRLENESLEAKINEAALEKATNEVKEGEMKSKLAQLGSELEGIKSIETELKKTLDEIEEEKVGLEAEMKKMRIQTEQWRKAADVAAAVLAGDAEMNGRRVSERCESLDKHISNMFDVYDCDEGFRGGKRKGFGMRMFGDLWGKKGQK